MREIKFRAWDPTCDHMIYSDCTEEDYWWRIGEDGISIEWYDQCIIKLTPDGPVETDGWVEISNSVIMEYTGNKDKNGKEIYEGDVVEVEEWREKADCTGSHWKWYVYVVSYQDQQWLPEDLDEAQIIGNIYENPELLEVL